MQAAACTWTICCKKGMSLQPILPHSCLRPCPCPYGQCLPALKGTAGHGTMPTAPHKEPTADAHTHYTHCACSSTVCSPADSKGVETDTAASTVWVRGRAAATVCVMQSYTVKQTD